jgi:hypothetical protein
LRMRKVVDAGELGRDEFKGVWTDGVDAVMQFDESLFFRRGERYRRFDCEKNEVTESGCFVRNGWKCDPLMFAMRRIVIHPSSLEKFMKNSWRIGDARIHDETDSLTVSELTNGEPPALVNTGHSALPVYTEDEFGDCSVSLELLGSHAGNSGMYLMGEYRINVSGPPGPHGNGFGGLSHLIPPRTTVDLSPGEWLKLELEFKAPRFKDGKKVSNAKFVKVMANGTLLHENVEIEVPTSHGCLTGLESAAGPLMFFTYSPIAFRNLQITAK